MAILGFHKASDHVATLPAPADGVRQECDLLGTVVGAHSASSRSWLCEPRMAALRWVGPCMEPWVWAPEWPLCLLKVISTHLCPSGGSVVQGDGHAEPLSSREWPFTLFEHILDRQELVIGVPGDSAGLLTTWHLSSDPLAQEI